MIVCMSYPLVPCSSLQLGVARGLIYDVNSFAVHRWTPGARWGWGTGQGNEDYGRMSGFLMVLSVYRVCDYLNVSLGLSRWS